jgi:hypothetical protein
LCYPPQLPSSIDTLKKHLLLLFDRLEKGSRLIAPSSTGTGTTAPAAAAGATSTAAGAGEAAAMPKSKSSKSNGANVNSRVDTKQAK